MPAFLLFDKNNYRWRAIFYLVLLLPKGLDFSRVLSLKAQRQMWNILQGVSSLGAKLTRKILAWYDRQFPS